jgi:hypothetical protein
MNKTMRGAVLPGNSTVELRDFAIPEPGHSQELVKTKSSTICGSDIRAIYREHVGKGAEGYQGPLQKAGEAYALLASGKCGKVAVVFDEELKGA